MWSVVVPLILLALPPAWQQAGSDDPCRRAADAHSRGDLAEAAKYLEICADRNPGEIAWQLRLCATYQSMGRDDDLYRAALKGTERFPGEPRFYLTAGVRAARKGDLNIAVDLFGRAFERWPEDSGIRSNLVQALLVRGMDQMDRKDYPPAEADFRRALELDHDNLEALVNLGRLLHNTLRSADSLAVFDRVLALRPDDPSIQLYRGIVMVVLGNYSGAIEALSRQIERKGDPEAFYFRGFSLKASGNCEQGVGDLEIASRGMSDNPDAFFALGQCQEKLGKEVDAESAYRRAVLLAPETPRFALALGRLLLRSGKSDEGRSLIVKAQQGYAQLVAEAPAQFQFKSTSAEQEATPPQ